MIQPRSLLVADSHPIVGDALIAGFRDRGDPLMVYQVYSVEDLYSALESLNPCAVVGEVELSGDDLLEEWKIMGAPMNRLPPLIVFSSATDWAYLGRAAVAGAYDYVFKTRPSSELVLCIDRAMRGETSDPSGVLAQMRRRLRRPRSPGKKGVSLTCRELQVLSHLAVGMSNREIGRALGISVETAKEHVQNILRKLHVNDRTQAALWAVQHELIGK